MKDYADKDRQDLIQRVYQQEAELAKIRAEIAQDNILSSKSNWFVQGKRGVAWGAFEW